MSNSFFARSFGSRFMACAVLSLLTNASWVLPVQAQGQAPAPGKEKKEKLFGPEQTLAISVLAPWGDIIRDVKNKNPYPATIEYVDSLGASHSIPLKVSRRGLTRQTVCKFPPIRLQFEKAAVKGTIFRGQKTLKLVTHCDKGNRWEQYYVKEMLAYRMYNLISDKSFRVRPLSTTYIDSGNNSADKSRFAFLVEDDGDVAKRNELKKLKLKRISPEQMDSLEASQMALFQYMIGNVDWSTLHGPGVELCCHNAKLIGLDPASAIYTLPYDFDSSGLVDAHYAAPNAGLPISRVTQRLYRGFCAHNPTLEDARAEFLSKEPEIIALVKNESRLNSRSVKVALRYLGDFFEILRSDKLFERNITQKCRR